MNGTTNNSGNENAVIQKVSDTTITLYINGKVEEIRNDFLELKTVLEKHSSPNLQVGEKIFNIGEIGQAEFNNTINQIQQESKQSYRLRLFLLVFVPILAISSGYLLFQYLRLHQPMVLTVSINNLTPNPSLPLEKASITLFYGDKTESQEVLDEAIFKGIPANFRGEDIKISFEANGFYSIDTVLELSENHITLPVSRDNTFAKIFGIVKEDGSGNRLDGVTISVQDINIKTDQEGKFDIMIPLEKQLKQQRVRAYKEGYKEWDRIEPVMPNEETIIHLQKTHK